MAGSGIKDNNERYDRQERIKDWKQDKILRARVAVVGSGRLSDLILADLLSIGVGTLTRIGYSSFFEFGKINPGVRFEQVDEALSSYQHARLVVPEADIIIDATNDVHSKYHSANLALGRGVNYLSATASKSGFALCPVLPKKDGDALDALDELVSFHHPDYHHPGYRDDGGGQGLLNSIVCSAIVADEMRKRLFTLKDDIIMGPYRDNSINESGVDGSGGPLDGKKILQIGAGAIGTFSGLALSLMGADLEIVDFDHIEDSNLNRQFLFYDDVGKNKAEALVSKLSMMPYDGKRPPMKYSTDKIGPGFNPNTYGNFDAMFSCVDNFQARYAMDIASKIQSLPLVDGGSSISACSAMIHVPGKTACLDCQHGGELSRIKPVDTGARRPAGDCFNPSLIISNQVSGALMVNTYIKSLAGNFERSDYMSGAGIFTRKIDRECNDCCR